MRMVFIFTREYSPVTKEWTEYRSYSVGFAETDRNKLKAEEYCKMCIDSDPCSCPVIANVKKAPNSDEEWELLTSEINRRYGDTARIQAFLQSLRPPFEEPFNYNQVEGNDNYSGDDKHKGDCHYCDFYLYKEGFCKHCIYNK